MVDNSSNDALVAALALVRLRATVFGHGALASPWGVRSPGLPNPVCFVITRGSAHLTLRGRSRIQRTLVAGDVVLIGAQLAIELRDSATSAVVPFERLVRKFRRESRRATTTLVCGSFELDAAGRDLFGATLPSLICLHAESGTTRSIVDAVTREVLEPGPGSALVLTRLAELLFLQGIRAHVAADTGAASWLRGLRHPALAAALAAIHSAPGSTWTVESLADTARMSRSAFARAFHATVGESPLAYLCRWRMRCAARLLEEDVASLKDIAAAVGYGSDEAFSRAFHSWAGTPPGRYRLDCRRR